MADLAIGVSKTALDMVVNKVKTAIKEEVKQWQIVQHNVVFITGEFEMMQSFLNSADGERIRNHVMRTWVRQVRDLSYDVEDCIEFVLHLDSSNRPWWLRLVPSWGRARAALPVDEAVAEITQLKARVLEVGQRNTRYSHMSESGTKPATPITPNAFGISMVDGLNHKHGFSRLHLVVSHLVNDCWDLSLRVISVYGARGDIATASVIRSFYDKEQTTDNFQRRAWVKLMHPFNPHEFVCNLLVQFLTNSCQDRTATIGVDVLTKLEEIQGNLVKEFVQEVSTHRYLIVLDDVSSMEQLDATKAYLPDRGNGSRVIVLTHCPEIAVLCTGKPCQVFQAQDHPSQVFYKEIRSDGCAPRLQDGLIGRDVETDELHKLMDKCCHVSVWGPPGVGKTALMQTVYHQSSSTFEKRCWADASLPFDGVGLAQAILSGLADDDGARPEGNRFLQDGSMESPADGDPIHRCQLLLENLACRPLIVIDGLRSKEEWDWINANITGGTAAGCCVVSVTADETVAKYCCAETSGGAVYRVSCLDAAAALRLFKKKADEAIAKYGVETSGGAVYRYNRLDAGAPLSIFEKKVPFEKDEHICRILSKCTGLPKLIVSLADHLAEQPSVQRLKLEIRLLSDSFMHQLEYNPKFHHVQDICTWLQTNFRASPQLLKKCIFYLSVFPWDSIIRRKRLVRRWMAEGYSRGTNSNSSEEEVEKLIDKLLNLCVLRPLRTIPVPGAMRVASCQVNSFVLEYIISQQAEEKTFLPLEVSVLEGGRSCLTTQHVGQHLAIGSGWERDEFVYSSLDLSRLRSLTVSGGWKPFFVSDRMRVLRVLDLEGTTDLNDGDLMEIAELLPRLKFLSLRGCRGITCLPDSVGDMRQLETLDIRHTSVTMLPECIVRLKNLQYIRAGTMEFFGLDVGTLVVEGNKEDIPPASNTSGSGAARPEVELPVPARGEDDLPLPGSSGRSSRMRPWLSTCFSMLPGGPGFGGTCSGGVQVPRGMGNLKGSLHTLGVVDGNSVAGKALLMHLGKKLPQLRKLAVCGLHWDDTPELLHRIV